MKVTISDLHSDESYVATCPEDCRDATDRSAYLEAVRLNDVVCMGHTIAQPVGPSGTTPCRRL